MSHIDQRAVDDQPRRLSARDRRIIAWTIVVLVVGGYVVWQLVGLATAKDAVPPSWLVSVPSGAELIGEPRVDLEPYRATTYVTMRPTDGRTAQQLIDDMGLTEQPTQLGPNPLDWRPVWVYSTPRQDGVELRLVYLRDSNETIVP